MLRYFTTDLLLNQQLYINITQKGRVSIYVIIQTELINFLAQEYDVELLLQKHLASL